MKTVLLLTETATTADWLPASLSHEASIVPLHPASRPGREQFDALFATWKSLADVVVLDGVSLGETARWALESLAATAWDDQTAIVVRLTPMQQSLFPIPPAWLVVSERESRQHIDAAVTRYLALRDAESKLRGLNQRLAQHDHIEPAAPRASGAAASAAADAHRYREALKKILELLGQHRDPATLLAEFAALIGELLSISRLGFFADPLDARLFTVGAAAPHRLMSVVASVGIRREIGEHLRLPLDSGIGGYLVRERRILWRSHANEDAKVGREFDLLGTEVAVPMFSDDQLLGVLTFGRKITGESLANDELELVYHLLAHLGQALRNLHLQEQIAIEQRFTSEVLANVKTGVVTIGQDARILSVNRRGRALLDLGERDVVGQPLRALPGRVADVLYEVLQTGNELRQREVVLAGVNRPLGLNVSRINSAVGEVVVALMDDLTQLKAEQHQKREAEEREFFTRVAYRLSHELKNSLVSIKIFGQLLPEKYAEKDFREQFSGVVVNEVNRVDVLINNLTFFAQPLGLVYEEVTLTDLIDTCIQNLTQEFTRKKLAHLVPMGSKSPEDASKIPSVIVKRNFSHKTAVVEADRIRLMQTIEHVMRNAVQSMPQGGRLIISTAEAEVSDFSDGKLPTGGAVRIEIQDTGEGIGLEILPRVTEPFVTTRNIGVGLGLTIVKKILERHSGRLLIDSMLGRGTTMTLVVPLAMQPHPEDTLLAQLAKAGGGEFSVGETEVAEQNRLALLLESNRRRRQQSSSENRFNVRNEEET